MTRILFITATRLGDAVLSTGLLDYLLKTYPEPRITIVCGALPAPLFDGVPGGVRVIILKKQKYHGHWLRLWREVVGTRWDIVVDLRNSAVSRFVCAGRRYIYDHSDFGKLHKVEHFAWLLGIQGAPPDTRVWVTEEQQRFAEQLIPDGPPVLGVGPASNWLAKTWPQDRFIDLIGRLTGRDGILPGARVVVFAAASEDAIARPVLESVPQEGRIDAIGKGDAGEIAAALARCAFYVGNDSGLMHLAAAAGVPTLGLFGPSEDDLYRPWGAHTAFVRTPETFVQLIDYPGYTPQAAPCLMESLMIDTVDRVATDLWRSL